MDREEELRRLRWQCRRGMLELDLLLNRFLESGYNKLSEEGKADFLRLLSYQDQILQDWLIGQAIPAEPAMRDLIRRVKSPAPDSTRSG
jgi:antitoxin CptB